MKAGPCLVRHGWIVSPRGGARLPTESGLPPAFQIVQLP
jgi:hypothetical protein